MAEGRVSPASDVYAFGIVTLNMLCHVPVPWTSEGVPLLVLCNLGPVPGRMPLPIANDVPLARHNAARSFVQRCTAVDPQKRLKMRQVLGVVEQLQNSLAQEPRSAPVREVDVQPRAGEAAASSLCIVCLEEARGPRFPCGHRVVCAYCVHMVQQCPICRSVVDAQNAVRDENPATFLV